jgi:hypothetical protein
MSSASEDAIIERRHGLYKYKYVYMQEYLCAYFIRRTMQLSGQKM